MRGGESRAFARFASAFSVETEMTTSPNGRFKSSASTAASEKAEINENSEER
jgi:hypothetical protein